MTNEDIMKEIERMGAVISQLQQNVFTVEKNLSEFGITLCKLETKIEAIKQPRTVEVLLESINEALNNSGTEERLRLTENDLEKLRGEFEQHSHSIDCGRPE